MPPNLLGLTEEQAEQLRDEERIKQKDRSAAAADTDESADGELPAEAGLGEGGGEDDAALVEGMKELAVVEEGEEGEGSDEEVSAGTTAVGRPRFFTDTHGFIHGFSPMGSSMGSPMGSSMGSFQKIVFQRAGIVSLDEI